MPADRPVDAAQPTHAATNPPSAGAPHLRPAPAHLQGMAVLLALVAVGLALMIGLALASTRDANTTASGGLVLATSTRTASSGALDIATFIAQRHSSSTAGSPNDESRAVFEPRRIGSFTLSAVMRDANTGKSPTTETFGLELTASGSTGAVTQTTRRTVRVEWANVAERADFDLSEFAALTTGGAITVRAGSEVSIWRDAPLARLARPIVLGNALRDPTKVAIDPNARVLGHAVVTVGNFPASDEEADELLANHECPLPENIRVPRLTNQGVPASFPKVNFQQLEQEINRSDNGRLRNLVVAPARIPFGRSTIPMPAPRRLVVDGPIAKGTWRVLSIDQTLVLNGAEWTFNERTMLIVRGDLRLTDSKIRVGPLGSLSILVSGHTELSRSTIGPDDGNAGNLFTADGTASYRAFGASRVLIQSLGSRMNLVHGAVLKGQVYGPSATIVVGAGSAVYGRLLGHSVTLQDGGNLFYDPELDAGTGWLNPRSGLWWRTNELRREVAAVHLLRDLDLSAFSTATAVAVDEPETGMLLTADVGAVGGFGVVTMNESVAGADTAQPNALPSAGAAVQYPDLYLVVNGILRDFHEHSEAGGHPDFDNPNFTRNPGVPWGLVGPELSADGKPVLATPQARAMRTWFLDAKRIPIPPHLFDAARGDFRGSVHSTAGRVIGDETSFDSWFRDRSGINLSEPYRIVMRRSVDKSGRTCYTYSSAGTMPFGVDGEGPQLDGFFPLQNRLFGNSSNRIVRVRNLVLPIDRNYHYTLELTMEFNYAANSGQALEIAATNDTWAFVDGRLALDLGGLHSGAWQMVPLDRLGLTDGRKATLKVFHANRQRVRPTFRIATNFPVTEPLPPAPPPGPTRFLEQLAMQRELTLKAFLKRG